MRHTTLIVIDECVKFQLSLYFLLYSLQCDLLSYEVLDFAILKKKRHFLILFNLVAKKSRFFVTPIAITGEYIYNSHNLIFFLNFRSTFVIFSVLSLYNSNFNFDFAFCVDPIASGMTVLCQARTLNEFKWQ